MLSLRDQYSVLIYTYYLKESDGIPEWVKNNAGWWSEGMIDDNEFLNGIKYLIENGIMKIN